ncbi:hypothetical protein MSHO_38140 [Mycobacterium shottsii]|uniref:Uncharacterized protein n=1 Tax=Mycobacterium shottsii TaxID=133549 RepID=A0A7I7LGH0_9MYCO|nr:hypothetical protein [Mycobacterium shottsii]BBX58469.1 hypothetical protein MSHO_38140 [Mycobacterium shottsii]
MVQTIGDVWHGVSSAGVTANWYSEAEEVRTIRRSWVNPRCRIITGVRGFRFSFEVGRDGAGFVDQVRAPLVDAIHQFKVTAHVNGTGTGQPTGFISALTGTSEVVVPGTVSDAVVAADPNALQSVRLPRSQ